MSAYQELIKNFERVRAYMREFYVYGFRTRDEVGRMSARSYDDERRRMPMQKIPGILFRQHPGFRVFQIDIIIIGELHFRQRGFPRLPRASNGNDLVFPCQQFQFDLYFSFDHVNIPSVSMRSI